MFPPTMQLGFPNVAFPSLMWAGSYDIFFDGNMQAWRGYQFASKPSSRGLSKLVIDPCGHWWVLINDISTHTTWISMYIDRRFY